MTHEFNEFLTMLDILTVQKTMLIIQVLSSRTQDNFEYTSAKCTGDKIKYTGASI